MAVPRIDHRPGELGFAWLTPEGAPAQLAELVQRPDAEADRWLPTHLAALDDVLIDVADRFGEVLGGGRPATREEREHLRAAYPTLDRLCVEYGDAVLAAGGFGAATDDPRAGQILGTAALMSIRARVATDLMSAAPFEGELDDPGLGVVGGRAALCWVAPDDAGADWRGARWLVLTDDGRRLPATLSMLLFDSSGVDKDAVLREHREALDRVVAALAGGPVADPFAAAGAVDWLLFDWVMAHRESPDSGAVELRSVADARMVVGAVAASVRLRAGFDPQLMPMLAGVGR